MLNPDFKDILSAFIAAKVEFLVVGAYAMAFHGCVSATSDIDLWIRLSDQNAEQVWLALQKFGAPLFNLNTSELKTRGMAFQIGLAPNRIDIVTQIKGVEFEEAWREHKTIEIENLTIPVIGKTQLLVNKQSTGRPKDRSDVLWLQDE